MSRRKSLTPTDSLTDYAQDTLKKGGAVVEDDSNELPASPVASGGKKTKKAAKGKVRIPSLAWISVAVALYVR